MRGNRARSAFRRWRPRSNVLIFHLRLCRLTPECARSPEFTSPRYALLLRSNCSHLDSKRPRIIKRIRCHCRGTWLGLARRRINAGNCRLSGRARRWDLYARCGRRASYVVSYLICRNRITGGGILKFAHEPLQHRIRVGYSLYPARMKSEEKTYHR